ncbi:hypothetical protein PINS_up009771 [Pythium insidiosum]|nr:hypothetical protein PINS_up009771 [Pythium insidiosum]
MTLYRRRSSLDAAQDDATPPRGRPTKARGAGLRVRGFRNLCGSPIRTDKSALRAESRVTAEKKRQSSGAAHGDSLAVALAHHCSIAVAAEDADEEEKAEEDEEEAFDALVIKDGSIPMSFSPWYDVFETAFAASDEDDAPLEQRHTEIDLNDVTMGCKIGHGAFGEVYKATWRGQRVAVKLLTKQELSDDVIREFEREIDIMGLLGHPNICRLVGASLRPSQRALVLELVEHGSLWNLLQSPRVMLTTSLRAKFALETARGMTYLHTFEHPILHRDMKSPNLLVDSDYTIKISDFGLARVKAQIQTMTGYCGTVQWMAPEVLGCCKYTEKADVYSFGIVLWEIFSRRCPYDSMQAIQVAMGVLNHDLRPAVPRGCPPFFAYLMQLCWERAPERRPSFEAIVRMCESVYGCAEP